MRLGLGICYHTPVPRQVSSAVTSNNNNNNSKNKNAMTGQKVRSIKTPRRRHLQHEPCVWRPPCALSAPAYRSPTRRCPLTPAFCRDPLHHPGVASPACMYGEGSRPVRKQIEGKNYKRCRIIIPSPRNATEQIVYSQVERLGVKV